MISASAEWSKNGKIVQQIIAVEVREGQFYSPQALIQQFYYYSTLFYS